MGLQAEKDFIKSEIEEIQDIYLIEAIKNMLAYGKAKRHEEGLKAMSIEDL